MHKKPFMDPQNLPIPFLHLRSKMLSEKFQILLPAQTLGASSYCYGGSDHIAAWEVRSSGNVGSILTLIYTIPIACVKGKYYVNNILFCRTSKLININLDTYRIVSIELCIFLCVQLS